MSFQRILTNNINRQNSGLDPLMNLSASPSALADMHYCLQGISSHGTLDEMPEVFSQIDEGAVLKQIKDRIKTAAHKMSVTIDTMKGEQVSYIAWSLQFVDIHTRRNSLVFLERTTLLNFDMEYLIKRVRSYFPEEKLHEKFDVIMMRNYDLMKDEEYMKSVAENRLVCMFTSICKLAEELMKIEEFHEPIKTLKSLVDKIRNDPLIFAELERITKINNPELPVYREGNWFSLVSFLERCFEITDGLEYIADNYDCDYVSDKSMHYLKYCQNILKVLRDYSNSISGEANCISDVYSTIMCLNKDFPTPAPEDFEMRIGRIVDKTLNVLAGLRSNRYCWATLLDPRQAYRTSTTSSKTWNDLEKLLRNEIVKEEMESNGSIHLEDAENVVEVEFQCYRRLLRERYSPMLEGPFGWWKTLKDEIPRLYKKAMCYLTPAATAIDIRRYFGNGGKYSRMCEKFHPEVLRKALMAATLFEPFYGRGLMAPGELQIPLPTLPLPRLHQPYQNLFLDMTMSSNGMTMSDANTSTTGSPSSSSTPASNIVAEAANDTIDSHADTSVNEDAENANTSTRVARRGRPRKSPADSPAVSESSLRRTGLRSSMKRKNENVETEEAASTSNTKRPKATPCPADPSDAVEANTVGEEATQLGRGKRRRQVKKVFSM